jgi:hypothetical protein
MKAEGKQRLLTPEEYTKACRFPKAKNQPDFDMM